MDFISEFFHAITQLHPIHAMVVHFPIALSAAAFLFLLIARWKKNATMEKAAFYNMILVTISTVAASITGIIDNETKWADAAPNHEWKVLFGILLFLISAASVYLRWRKPELLERKSIKNLYLIAYGVCFLLALTLGFLGGVILYGF